MARIVPCSLASVFAFLGLIALTFLAAAPARADFQPVDIFLNNSGGNNIQQYRNGSLIQTFTGTGSFFSGASLTSDGNLVTKYLDDASGATGVDIFSADGTQITSFTTPGVAFVGDVSVFADGTLALSDDNYPGIRFYSQSGTLLDTVYLPHSSEQAGAPFGNAIALDDTLYVVDSTSRSINHVDENGTVLDVFTFGFNPADLVVAPDGSLYVTDARNERIVHFDARGNELDAFSVASSNTVGIGLAPDASSIFVTGQKSSSIYHYDLDGNLLDSFAISNPQRPTFLTVVPSPVPEPGLIVSFGLAGVSGLAILARRRADHARR